MNMSDRLSDCLMICQINCLIAMSDNLPEKNSNGYVNGYVK